MEVSCVPPDLRQLDGRDAELLVCGVFSDERPLHGVAGLAGWRLAGMIDRLLESGFYGGAEGDALLLPGKPRLCAEKLVLIGLGARAGFSLARAERAIERLVAVARDLDVRSMIVEVPGRHVEAIDAEAGVDALLAALAAADARLDRVALVESAAAHNLVRDRVARARRLAARG
ncbi:MAG: leucyl aminopeptidase [Polyangiaceae bacterium]|nr:leucyl aminopeptidase [Polyangiaceae bacterium]